MTALLVTIVWWAVAGVVVGVMFARRDWQMFHSPGRITRLRSWETKERYERMTLVRLWKDRLPEAGTWFGGISKRRLPRWAEGGRSRFAAESLRAERVHLTLLLGVPIALIWSRSWWLAANVAIGLGLNLPCIIVARYNRLRLMLLG